MKYLATFLVLFVSYLLLAGFTLDEVIVGAIVSLILSLIITNMVSYKVDVKLPIRLVLFLVLYVPIFLLELIKSNLNVALRVVNPKLPIHPGFVKVQTALTGDFQKLLLANSITLTPGTLSVDIDGDYLYIHTVDVRSTEAKAAKIGAKFERILGVIFK
jgi:multicomponent Na+:H+ antiporter subunit E